MYGRCCCAVPEFTYGPHGGSRRHFGPSPWSPRWGWGGGAGFGWSFAGPSKAERKKWLEAFKQHLEERLADVNEALEKLEA